MPDYQRIVSYMFQYNSNTKNRNVGYAKVEARGEQCKINIHITIAGWENKLLRTYMFYRHAGRYRFAYLGTMFLEHGEGNLKVKSDRNNVMNSDLRIEDMCGVIAYQETNRYVACAWDDMAVPQDLIRFIEGTEAQERAERSNQASILKFEKPQPEEKAVEKPVEPQQQPEPIKDILPIAEKIKEAAASQKAEPQPEEEFPKVSGMGLAGAAPDQSDWLTSFTKNLQRLFAPATFDQSTMSLHPEEEKNNAPAASQPEKLDPTKPVVLHMEEKPADEFEIVDRKNPKEEIQQENSPVHMEALYANKEYYESPEESVKQDPYRFLEYGIGQEEQKEVAGLFDQLDEEKVNESLSKFKDEYYDQVMSENYKEKREETCELVAGEEKECDQCKVEAAACLDELSQTQNVTCQTEESCPCQDEMMPSEQMTAFDREAMEEQTSCSQEPEEKPCQEETACAGEAADQEMDEHHFFEYNPEPEMDDGRCYSSKEHIYNYNQTMKQETKLEVHPIAKLILSRFPKIYPFEDNEIAECVRIEPQDIGLLPIEAWILGNNSFLLHGYYSYKHLIFGKINRQNGYTYVLGVPGVYQNRERFMAKMFGFDEFKCAKRKQDKTGEFGYWYVPIILN